MPPPGTGVLSFGLVAIPVRTLTATKARTSEVILNRNDIQTVIEDLDYLKANWSRSISDPEARRGSAVLRRLLVEDAYGQAWRAVGFHTQPRVIAVDLKNVIGAAPLSDVKIALAGGVRIRSILSAGLCITSRKYLRTVSPPITEEGFLGEREFTLSEYLSSGAGIVAGRTATRQDVVKYFANIKGGVHVGKKKRGREEAKLIARMEKFEKRVSFFQKDGLLIELIAVGHALARSPDTHRFLEYAK